MSDDKPTIGMLKKHKNGFINTIKDSSLNVDRFRVEETPMEGREAFVLQVTGTPFLFAVAREADNFNSYFFRFTRFSPRFDTDVWTHQAYSDIESMYVLFGDWIEVHVIPYIGEQEEPDLWAQIQSQTPVVSDEPVGSDDREPFTQPEQVQLRMAIKEFRQVIIEKHAPNDERQKLIDNRLEYLTEQLPQLNRINWRSVALTTLIAIVIQLTLSTEQGKVLFEMGQRIFSNIVPLLPE